MGNLQDFLSITQYDIFIICLELFYVISLIVLFLKSSNILFDIDLPRLKAEQYNMYVYSVICIITVSFLLVSGVISREAQESPLGELINLVSYSVLGLSSLLIRRAINSSGRYGSQITNQLYNGNIAAFIYHTSQIFCTSLVASFSIRSFYGENMAYIMFIIVAAEIVVSSIMQVYNTIFYRQYGLLIEQAVAKKDWHVALQTTTFRLLASTSICISSMLVLIAQNMFLLSLCILLLTSMIIMILILGLVTISWKLFLKKDTSMHLIDPSQNGVYCIQHFLLYMTICIFITFIIT
ncbi:MAG: hypothetical protein ACRY3E_03735 [Candidatus Lariskella arthropodorum]